MKRSRFIAARVYRRPPTWPPTQTAGDRPVLHRPVSHRRQRVMVRPALATDRPAVAVAVAAARPAAPGLHRERRGGGPPCHSHRRRNRGHALIAARQRHLEPSRQRGTREADRPGLRRRRRSAPRRRCDTSAVLTAPLPPALEEALARVRVSSAGSRASADLTRRYRDHA